jgi:hypothetical protein
MESHRIQKQKPVQTTTARSTKNPVWILGGRLNNLTGARRKHLGTNFAVASDGFIGAELTTRHKKGTTRPRDSNYKRTKRSTCTSRRLALACGHLPAPQLEHHVGAPPLSEPVLPLGGAHTSFQAQIHMHERPILTQCALTKTQRATSDEEPRYRYGCYLRQHENLVCSQLSSITAPVRRFLEDSGSEHFYRERYPSDGFDNNTDSAHDITQSPHIVPLACMPIFAEDTSYFENAMHNLDVADGSNSFDNDLYS